METDALSTTFAALADPTRRAILARLAQGSATVKELSMPFSMSGPAISKHLRVLERAGLISQGRDAQFRPCHLEAAPLKAVADWTDTYRRFWEASFDRLEEYLKELQTPASAGGADKAASAAQSRGSRAIRSTRRPKREHAHKKGSERRATQRPKREHAHKKSSDSRPGQRQKK